MIDEDTYYEYMCHMEKDPSYDVVHKKWFLCFERILKMWGFNYESIERLFYHFKMENWEALHLDKSPHYKNHTKEELIDSFFGECHYVSDRISFDRLFRVHWLFLRGYDKEISEEHDILFNGYLTKIGSYRKKLISIEDRLNDIYYSNKELGLGNIRNLNHARYKVFQKYKKDWDDLELVRNKRNSIEV